MATYKCKMCGGLLEVKEGQTVVTCEFCGTAQTVPHFDNEKKATFFRRANDLRLKCEFDKASGVYETIVTEFPNEAEAYWGLVLCKYGIEYVDDPKTHKKIPTCHRTQFSSIFEDHDYLSAVKHADAVAREIYNSEANAISKLQSAILEISSKEDPFDVFICYKETDERGGRTADSVLAQDIYDELTSAGYKVFFARRTLERKLGSEYEPYIFAALHSAKVMLHVTTSKTNSDSVWVRNEWARYLSLIGEGQKKTLIPCYKGISAYDLPEEMKNLQAQDMSKIGAMQDLVYGVKKIIKPAGRVVTHEVEKEESFVSDTGYDGLIRKGYTYLKNHKVDQAQRCFDKAVEATELCGDAYLGMVLCEYELESLEELLAQDDLRILENENFKLAREFANKSCNATLDKVENAILTNEKKGRYNQAKSALEAGRFDAAIEGFKELGDFEDSIEQIKECIYQKGQMYFGYIKDIRSLGYCDDAIACFEEVISYKDSKALIEKANALRVKITEEYKADCISRYLIVLPKDVTLLTLGELVKSVKSNRDRVFNPSFSEFDNARAEAEASVIKFFNEKCPALIQSFKTLDECSKLTGLCSSIEKDKNLQSVHELIKQREHEIKEQIRILKKKRRKKGAIITAITCGALAVAVATFFGIKAIVDENNRKATYASANTAMEAGNYDDAIAYYESLGNYNESQKKIQVCKGLKQLEASIESKSEADAIQGIKTIVSAGEKVDVSYETENNVNIRRLAGGNSGNKTETIETVDFSLYQPSWSGYTFLNWNSDSLSYKNERTYLGMMSNWSLDYYSITYDLDGGSFTGTPVYSYSIESPEITLVSATKIGHKFDGWFDNNGDKITSISHGSMGNISVTAHWIINVYDVLFKNYDGTVLYSTTCEHGSTVSYVGSTPTKPADSNSHHYVFTGWDKSLSNITENTIFTAQFDSVINSYTITWKNYDGTTLMTSSVNHGSVPTYPGSTPTKPSTAQYSYTFSGWSPSLSAATGDAAYTALFNESVRKYTITWKNDDGTTLKTEQVEYGEVPSYTGSEPTKAGGDEYHTYAFDGWTPDVVAVTGDATYTAKFRVAGKMYTITWKNWDGSLLTTSQCEYGTMPVYPDGTPTRPSDAQYNYSFSWWKPYLTTCTGEATYTAVYGYSTRKYTITWLDDDLTALKTEEVYYGNVPYYGDDPEPKVSGGKTLIFSHWSPEVKSVTGEKTYTAVYTEAPLASECLKTTSLGNNLISIDGFKSGYEDTASLYVPTKINGYTVSSISEDAFRNSSLKTVYFEASESGEHTIDIGHMAFGHSSKLERVTLKDSVRTLGEDSFTSCSSLTYVKLPDNITEIPDECFRTDTNLTYINWPTSLESIGEYAFQNVRLSSVRIPDSVTSLGNYSFSDCSSLTYFYIGSGVQQFNATVTLNCTSLQGITVSYQNEHFTDNSGVVWTKDSSSIVACPRGSKVIGIGIGGNLTSIGYFAFWYCTNLESITLPASLEYIGYQAFYHCSSLKEIKYSGTIEQFSLVNKGAEWLDYAGTSVIICSDGTCNMFGNPI